MIYGASRSATIIAAFVVIVVTAGLARAAGVPSIVVTPYYVPTSIEKAGSTVSVITADQIARSSAGTVADLLRSVPGLTVTESGGAGGQALVNLRGAEAGHTLVLIDGVRVNDPASARDEFDFATLSVTDIARIEILRGPQTALYGSDAMGGVINIITRRPTGGTSVSVTAEGGSYGTRRTSVSASGGAGPVSLIASGTYFANTGFSRVGDRDHGEPDGTEKYAGTVRGAIDARWRHAPRFRLRRLSPGVRHRQVGDGRRRRLHLDPRPPVRVRAAVVRGHGRPARQFADRVRHEHYARLRRADARYVLPRHRRRRRVPGQPLPRRQGLAARRRAAGRGERVPGAQRPAGACLRQPARCSMPATCSTRCRSTPT